ncbi:hypothetical protein VPH184E373B_0162 [Vibrio phage 184E37-3b]
MVVLYLPERPYGRSFVLPYKSRIKPLKPSQKLLYIH